MDPSRLISGSQDGNESQAQSGQPTEYAEVVGVMKAAPKKPKTKKWTQVLNERIRTE